MGDNGLGHKVVGLRDTVNTVAEGSEFWHGYTEHLAALRQQFTGREAEHLERVKSVLHEGIERAREALIHEIGLDITTGRQLRPAPRDVLRRKRNWLANVEQYGQDFMKTGRAVAQVMVLAERNGRDPVLEGFAMFFWAMKNVPASGTVFLMLNTEGQEKEHTTLLTAGWADAHISLRGQHANRLRAALLAEGGDPRRQLRQELPGAVLEAAPQWRPGFELPVGDRPLPKPDKETAGRRERTLLSRITRLIERQGTSETPVRARKAHAQAERWQAGATRRAARGGVGDPSGTGFGALWRAWVQSADLGPHEAQIARYVADNPDCLDVKPDGGLRLRRGTQVEMARVLGRSAVQVRQETLRMLRKLEKARHQA